MLPLFVLAHALAVDQGPPPAPSPPALSRSPELMPATPPTATPPTAPKNDKCRVLVFNLVGRALPKADEELPPVLTEALASEIGPASNCDVTTQADITAMLDFEKQKAVCTEGSDSCLAEIGQAFGADRVVAGTLSKVGSEYVVTAKLMNVRKGAVDERAEQATSDPNDLRRSAKNVGRRLFHAPDLPASTSASAPAASAPAGSFNFALWGGVAIGVVGLAAAGTGGYLAYQANTDLTDPQTTDKDATHSAGLVELGVAAGGAVVAIVGAVVAVVGAMP
jgi:hypothetical protein